MDAFVKLVRSTASADSVAAPAKKKSYTEKRKEKKTAKDEKKKANESKIRSLRTQIGSSIVDAFESAPSIRRKKGGKLRGSTDDGSISSVDSLNSSTSSRQRKTSLRSVASDDVSLESIEQTPRRGAKKKRSRSHGRPAPSSARSAPSTARSAPSSILVMKGSRTPDQSCQEYHRPTTDFVGWRRLRLHELTSVKIGDSFILIIPGDARTEDESLTKSRADVRFRLLRHVKPFFGRETHGVTEDLMFETLLSLINEKHGISRTEQRISSCFA